MMCAIEEMRAVLIACFKSIAHELRNNACNVTYDAALRILRSYVAI